MKLTTEITLQKNNNIRGCILYYLKIISKIVSALSVVLGSLYQDEVSLEPKEVVSILATSTLFQLQGLIDECVDIMIETTNSETVVSYYNAAVSYGVPTVKAAAKRWLEVNLLGYGWRHPSFLKEISPDLMTELVASPDLVVLQTEFCIYMMLRLWYVCRCNIQIFDSKNNER